MSNDPVERRPARVLVVEDDAEARRALELSISLAGHRCASAHTIDAALALCTRATFDCMILDEQLGTDSGLALAATLRRVPELRPARIVLVTGVSSLQLRGAGEQGTVDVVMQKPVDFNALLAAVAESVDYEKPTAAQLRGDKVTGDA